MPFKVIATLIAVVTGIIFLFIGSFEKDTAKFKKYSTITITTGVVLIVILVAVRFIFF